MNLRTASALLATVWLGCTTAPPEGDDDQVGDDDVTDDDNTGDDDTLLGPDDEHNPASGYGLGTDVNDGEDMWEFFVRLHANIAFVFSGHIDNQDGAGRLVSTGDHGNTVYQVMANYQNQGNTGNLRIVTFLPADARVTTTTYSPWTDEWLTDDENQFVFEDVAFFQPPR